MRNIVLSASPLIQPKSIDSVLPAPFMLWWQWALIGIAIAVTSLLIYLLSRQMRSGGTVKAEQNPLLSAEEEIRKLLSQAHATRSFPVQISVIMRQYLLRRFNGEALFMTQREVDESMLRELPLTENLRLEALDFLRQLDRLKYSGQPREGSLNEMAETLKLLLYQMDKEYFTKLSPEAEKFSSASSTDPTAS